MCDILTISPETDSLVLPNHSNLFYHGQHKVQITKKTCTQTHLVSNYQVQNTHKKKLVHRIIQYCTHILNLVNVYFLVGSIYSGTILLRPPKIHQNDVSTGGRGGGNKKKGNLNWEGLHGEVLLYHPHTFKANTTSVPRRIVKMMVSIWCIFNSFSSTLWSTSSIWGNV